MADNENFKKPFQPRKNHPSKPPHGVQKAMQNFGVKDLREILDRKHQDRGDSQGENEKKPDAKVKLPPPDPSYNYLRDPTRDNPKQPPTKKGDGRKPLERPHSNQAAQHDPKKEQPRNREQDPNRNPIPEENHAASKEEKRKELRFSDTPKIIDSDPQFPKEGRSSFRGRNPRRGRGGKPRGGAEGKIVNPVNIKVEVKTETGQRSCILDESTKIADIMHVPDQRPPRGSFRGGRGYFRGRGRGRGSFRGRRIKNQVDNPQSTENTSSENNTSNEDGGFEKSGPDSNDNEHEEFADSNDNYERDYTDSVERIENVDKNASGNTFDPNLSETITITSSKYQDGDVKRSVEVRASSDAADREEDTPTPPKCDG